MSEVAERYARVAAGFGARLDGVPPDGWSQQSPCTDWTARDVAAHVVDTHRRVLSNFRGGEPARVGPDDDLRSEWALATGELSAALADEALSSTTVGGMFGEQSFEALVGRLVCADTLIHTWDLARATGQDDRLDDEAVARALEFLAPLDEAIRRPGGMAAKIEPSPGADPQTLLLNFAGRAG